MCLVWRRFKPLRYVPVNRADGVDGALAILGRQLIDDRSHPGDQTLDQDLLFGGHAAVVSGPCHQLYQRLLWNIVTRMSCRRV